MTACDASEEEFADADESVEARDVVCPTWRCGYNSAEVNGRSIRELNLDGQANADGVRIVGFVAPTGLLGDFTLDVIDDELVARSGQVILRGAQLTGATILVKSPASLVPLPITILFHQDIESWAAGAADVATYTLVYPDLSTVLGFRNVCTGDLTDTLFSAATVLGGETYDLTTKTVQTRPRWLTIACAGSAAAKMRLLNYGPQSDFDGAGHPATVAQRQATLKMITGDYCGGGVSYTQNGTPLQWKNAGGTVTATNPGAREAAWSASGALCLDTTRLPGVTPACSLPACSSVSPTAGEWTTYVP